MDPEPFTTIAPYYDEVMSRIPYTDWADYVELLLRHWRGSRRRVLDLACGTGSVALELARRGSRVVGVDLVRGMLEVGRRKSLSEGLEVGFARQDMRALGLGPAFDLALCLFDSLNYLLNPNDLLAVFQGVRQALRPDALFIFDVNTELALEMELFTQDELDQDGPVRIRWTSRYDRRSRTTEVQMEFHLDDGRILHEVHHERAHSATELREALDAVGLRTLAVYDAYTFRLPKRSSDRVFYVCRASDGARS